ncbi:unnamed protein product [Ixodes pacificus]
MSTGDHLRGAQLFRFGCVCQKDIFTCLFLVQRGSILPDTEQ